MVLTGVPTVTKIDETCIDGIATWIRPVTLGRGSAVPLACDKKGISVGFELSEPAVTPYFAVKVASGEVEVEFLIAAELVDPPPGRTERVLSGLLANRADLIRFLLLLLGNTEDALAAFDGDGQDGTSHISLFAGRGSEALLEPLVRTFARNPERLRDVERLVEDLHRCADATSVLPDRWHEVWDPIAAALNEVVPR
jgi:hypothetical protein